MWENTVKKGHHNAKVHLRICEWLAIVFKHESFELLRYPFVTSP